MLLVTLLLTCIFIKSQANLLSKLQPIGSLSNFDHPLRLKKMGLITDIIAARRGENVVFIISIREIHILRVNFGGTYIESDRVTEEMMEDLELLKLKNNKPCFYIILPIATDTDDKIEALITTIKNSDTDSTVAVVYDDPVDVVNLYRGKQFYNIHVFNPGYSMSKNNQVKDVSHKIEYTMFAICRFCLNGNDQLELVNTLRYNTGFRQQVQFKKSFIGNLHKTIVSMGVDENYPPNFHNIGENENGDKIYDGVDYRLYIFIGKVLNLTWRFLPNRFGSPWSFDSYLKDLNDGYIDFIGSGWSGRYGRYKAAGDMTQAYTIVEGDSIISLEPTKGVQGSSIYKAFDIYTWLFLFSCIPVCGIALYISGACARDPGRKANIWTCFWAVIVILFWESMPLRRQASYPDIFVLGTFILMIFIIISEYFGIYTAVIINRKYNTPPIENLDQIWDSNLKWIPARPQVTNTYLNYFKHVENFQKRLYTPTQENTADHQAVAALKQVRASQGQVVLFANRGFAEFYINTDGLKEGGGRGFYISKQTFKPFFQVLYCKEPCYFSEHINRAILLMRDMYINILIEDRYYMVTNIRAKLVETSPLVDIGLIQLQHLVTAGKIIGGVCGLSLISFMMEIIHKRLLK